jgi:LPXTG-motif cell wall-anchored protein
MKVRKILAGAAAIAIGSLAALALATPASATAKNPTVEWAPLCDAKGKVTVTVKLPTGGDAIDVQVVTRGGEVKATKPALAGGGTWAPTVTDTVLLQVKYRSAGAGQYGSAISEFVWDQAAPGVCKPTIETFNATCDNLNLGLSLGNPVAAALEYTFSGGVTDSGTLTKGQYAAADEVVGKDINYTWRYGSGISGSGTAKYVLPKDCAAGTPGAVVDPPAKPGKKFHGNGRHTHVVYVPVANNAGGGTTAAGGNQGGDSSSTAAAGGQSDDSLPVTGSRVGNMLLAGFLLVAAGVVGIVVARRRRAIRFTSAG